MLINYYGTQIHGSSELQTSISNEEIIPSGSRYTDFSLYNDQDCHISINGGNYIFLRASQGLELYVVSSLKIQEDNINFNWLATLL